ncbi:N-6 DNA methylase [Pseudonocardia alni]|uniref:N-6 DNA methylase n=1 Tax=Pseudonocardia alni TaxID=33907 RepID=UPI0033F534AC
MSADPGASPTVAAGDIARLAGVGRAAVSNWRRRFTDFPEPVGGSAASPLYRLDEVERWLTAHDRLATVPPLERAWQALRAGASDLDLGSAVAATGAVLLGRDESRLAPDVRDLLLLAAEDDGPDVVHEFVVGQYLGALSRRLAVVPEELATAMATVAVVVGGGVLDPACGTGGLLRAAVRAGADLALGQERDPVAAEIAAHRVGLAPRADGDVAVGDALREDAWNGRLVDAVVSVPPVADRNWGFEELAGDPRWLFGLPPKLESELAWVQHCLAHVAPGGRVVVQLPSGVAFRRSGRRIRNELLRAGALDAVVGLPRDGALPTDVWVLHRPEPDSGPPQHLLIALATAVEDLPAIWRRHRDGAPAGEGARAVPILDLLDDEVDLSPERHVRLEPDLPDVAAADARFRAALSALPRAPHLKAAGDRSAHAVTTIADLVKAGVVSVHQGPIRHDEATSPRASVPVLTVHDVHARRGPTGRTAATTPGHVPLRPGDVVVPLPAARGAGAVVVAEGGAVLGPRTQLLRTDPDRLDPHYLAGLLWAAAAGETRTTGRSDVRRLVVPVPPMERQREIGSAFRTLAELETALREVRESGEALVRGAVQGLGAGTLEPSG